MIERMKLVLVLLPLCLGLTAAITCGPEQLRFEFFGDVQCFDCGDGWVASADQTECLPLCPAGTFYGDGCVDCAKGSWSPANSMMCYPCPDGETTLGRGAGAEDECIPESEDDSVTCPAGSYVTKAESCRKCPKNTYSRGGTATKCRRCADNEEAPVGSTKCTKKPCEAGSFMTANKGCRTCRKGSFSGPAATICIECAPDKTSPAGSTSIADCSYVPCMHGFYMTESGCTACPLDTYNDQLAATSRDSCLRCPPGTFSFEGSTTRDDCVAPGAETTPPQLTTAPLTDVPLPTTPARCAAGNFLFGSICIMCPENTYSSEGANVCSGCPEGRRSGAGSTGREECQYDPCEAGYHMTDAGCAICPVDTYSVAAAEECSPCPGGKEASEGSTSSGACQYAPCKAGYHLAASGCLQCGPGTYSGPAADLCLECLPGTATEEGAIATSIDDCKPLATETPEPDAGQIVQTEPKPEPTEPKPAPTEPKPAPTEPPTVPAPPKEAELQLEHTSPYEVNYRCVDKESGEVLEEGTFETVCSGKVLSCEQDGYSYTEVEVEVSVLDGEDSSANVVLESGESKVVEVSLSGNYTVTWKKGQQTLGLGSTLAVSSSGRYTAELRRCPQHEAVNHVYEVMSIARPAAHVQDGKHCYVYGDPHLSTFDGTHYSFQGACSYVLAMDCASYSWYLYGKFVECGEGVTCIEAIDVLTRQGTVELKRGFGVNLNGQMFGLKTGESVQVSGVDISFDGRVMTAKFGEVALAWDGLSFLKITVPESLKTCGLCADNDGSDSNDVSHFLFTQAGASFADTWAVTRRAGACGVHELNEIEVSKDNIDSVKKRLSEAELGDLTSYTAFIEAAAHDLQQSGSPFKEGFMECSCIKALVEYVKDTSGVAIEGWEAATNCPSPQEMLREGVRTGCPWTKSNAELYLE